MNHQDNTGRGAIHQFAFVQATDPALDADNEVAAFKAWIDTGTGNVLKVRNESNTAWLSLVVGGGAVSSIWGHIDTIESALYAFGFIPRDFAYLDYV